MRIPAALLLSTILASVFCTGADAADMLSTKDFVSRLGVNVHVEYTDGDYHNVGQVISDLKYLGIANVRDANLNPRNQGQRAYFNLADAGIRMDLIMLGGHDPADSIHAAESLQTEFPGSVVAIEGPNEIDHAPFKYQGQGGGPAAIALQQDLYRMAKASDVLKATPVYSFSLGSGATPTGGYDAVALHPYPQNGTQPGAWIHKEARMSPPGATSVITEAGYASLPTWTSKGVDEDAQARLTLNLLFDSALQGFQAIYLYELLDAYDDPTGKDGGQHYGLFDHQGNPKKVAVALHNLTSILASDAPGAALTDPGVTLSGTATPPNQLILAKSHGVFDIVVWQEPRIWDSSKHARVEVADTPVKVSLGQAFHSAKVYDPLTGTAPVTQAQNATSVDVALSDHPVIVEIEPGPRAQ